MERCMYICRFENLKVNFDLYTFLHSLSILSEQFYFESNSCDALVLFKTF